MGAAAGEGGRRRQEGTGPPPRENSHVAGATTQVKILVPGDQSMVALLGQRDVFLKIIESAFDCRILVRGNEIKPVRRLPTGIFEFDFYTGGGFPCGRYSTVYGPESSNKTNLCLKAVASAQRQKPPCNKAVWVNIEQTFDPAWAEKMGVDTKELLVVQAGYGEEAIDLVDALVRAEDVAILVVDSLAGLIASK